MKKSFTRAYISAALSMLLLNVSTAANASAFAMLMPQLAASVSFVITPTSQCISYVYDENGNRTAIVVDPVDTGPVLWGSGRFGCFVWTAS